MADGQNDHLLKQKKMDIPPYITNNAELDKKRHLIDNNDRRGEINDSKMARSSSSKW